MSDQPTIIWFRRDLRIDDNPCIRAAAELKSPTIAIFIYSQKDESPWNIGEASKWWLHHSLNSLKKDLKKIKIDLHIFEGSYAETLSTLIKKTNARRIFWSRIYDPAYKDLDEHLRMDFENRDLEVKVFEGNLLMEPWELKNKTQSPYKVFTPFYNAFLNVFKPAPNTKRPESLIPFSKEISSKSIEDLKLLPKMNWDKDFYTNWTPGESGAQSQLQKFLGEIAADYKEKRDIPSLLGTSRLSPHLHFGEISPLLTWNQILAKTKKTRSSKERINLSSYAREIVWREFAHYILFHFSDTPENPLNPTYRKFPYQKNTKFLEAWKKGMTGFPIVDAGMRELWNTGWMHNRVRMVVASFLTKHLLQDWKEGAHWFWQTLVDADLANNTMGWQWAAGCGADAAPYFRVFNPILQGEKFDPDGTYIRKWIPELAALPRNTIHTPWLSPLLAKNYPRPIVSHEEGRKRALDAFKEFQSKN